MKPDRAPHLLPRYLVALLCAGCADSTPSADGAAGLTQSEADAVAEFIASQPALPGAGVLASNVSSRPRIIFVTAYRTAVQVGAGPFTNDTTVNCPAGGTVRITGNGTRTPNQQTRQMAVTFTPTNVFANCGVGSVNNVSVIVSGSMSGNGTATWRFPDQPGGMPTLLAFNVTRSGTLTYMAGSRTGTCAATVTTTGQGDQFHNTGTVCDRQIDNTRRPLGLRN
jgi:hypothetical protein